MKYNFLFGRNALYHAALDLKNRGQTVINVPAYCCGDEINPILDAGLRVQPYDITFDGDSGSFRPVESIPAGNNLVTNFFGLEFATSQTATIVDNAYKLDASTHQALADYEVYSFRKQLARPNGAYLITQDELQASPELVTADQALLEQELNNYQHYASGGQQGSGMHPGINANNIFGPRYANRGGYSLTCALEHPSVAEMASRSSTLQDQFKRCLAILERYIPNHLLIAEAMQQHRVAFPVMLPVVVENSVALHAVIAREGFTKAVPFWSKDVQSLIDLTACPEALKLKQTILAFSFIYSWTEKDFVLLEKILEKGIIRK